MVAHLTGEYPMLHDTTANPEASCMDDVAQDQLLLAELRAKQAEHKPAEAVTGTVCMNREIAARLQDSYGLLGIRRVLDNLDMNDTFDIPIKRGSVRIGDVTHMVSLVAATETAANHGEMSKMWYGRDHFQAARNCLELYRQDPVRHQADGDLGRVLLRSGLLLMSTPSQLQRFEDVIKLGRDATQADWPQISLYFNDLEGEHPNGWRNKQDSLQMLGHLTLDALESGFLKPEELTPNEQQFLGYLVPFMAAVGYPRYESSGSWEELTAVRTSVMAVETALLHKMSVLLAQNDPAYEFLRTAYDAHRPEGAPDKLEDCVGRMLQEGMVELGQRLPNESGLLDTKPDSIKYREADAALTYVLMYDIPQLLAEYEIPIGSDSSIMTAVEIENLILEQLDTLTDPVTGGMFRYLGDSYQRTNFHTHQTQRIIRDIKRYIKENTPEGADPDLDKKQELRDALVEQGREAAWTHPVAQLAAWAARRSIESADQQESERYRRLSTTYFNRVMGLVTGQDQYTAALQADGTYDIEKVPAYKLPECYITYRDKKGIIIVASPHTPLNWSTAETRKAAYLLQMAIDRCYRRSIGLIGVHASRL